MNLDYNAKVWNDVDDEIKDYGVKLKPHYYDKSPFMTEYKSIIPIIIKYAERCNSPKDRMFLLSTLSVKGYDDAVPYLVDQYKHYISDIYSEPFDDILLSHLCNTIMKIESKRYIELYIDMMHLPSTTALECIIKMAYRLTVTK